jgi:hypothetical protein
MGLIVRDEDLPHSLRINLATYCLTEPNDDDKCGSLQLFYIRLNQELAKFNAIHNVENEHIIFNSEKDCNWFLLKWS